nr:xylulose kinase-1 [Tanacetum cinerariifolium]
MAETDENTTNPPTNLPTYQAPHTLSTIKLHILKKCEYDIWAMKMEHYLKHTDYPIWEIIQKGNSPVQVLTDTHGQIRVLPLKTAEEILAKERERERERKAKTTLLMAILEDHLEKFYKMTDVKEMWEAIKSRFGGNDESKKMHKYLLKQQFKSVSTKDANQKFLRSLPSFWSQVSLIIWTKLGVDTLNFDDLYNNLRVFEYDVKDLKQVDEFDLKEMDLKWQVAMISTRLKKFYKKTERKLHFDAKESVGFDKRKVECFNFHNIRHFAREYRSKENQDSVDWTGHANDETKDYALMAYNFSNSGSDTKMSAKDKSGLGSSDVEDSPVNDRFAKVKGMHAVLPPITGNYMPPKFDFGIDESKFTYGPKQSTTSESNAKTSDLDSCDSNSGVETLESVPKPVANEPKAVIEPKVWSDAPIIEEYESDSDDEHVTIPLKEQKKPSFAFVNTVKHIKTPRQTVKEQHKCSQNPKPNNRDWDGLMFKRMGLGYGFTKKACFLITAENKVNKTAGPKEANHSTGTRDSFNAGNSKIETEHAQEYYVLPLRSSYTSTVKSSKAKNGDEKLNEDTDSKTNEELIDQGDQAFLEDLERIKRQEKEATDAAKTLRKTFAQSTKDLLLQAGATRASSINFVNTATTPVNAACTPTNQDASQIPALKILMHSGYRKGLIDKTLFIKKDKKDIMLTASTPIEIKKPLVKDEEAADVTSKTSHLQAVKRIFRHLKGKPKLSLWYPRDSPFDLEAYSDSDYAGANLDRKSTTRGCQFLGRILISWQCKKQKNIATSTTEAEGAYEKKLIQVLKIYTDDNVADLLTKAFNVSSAGDQTPLTKSSSEHDTSQDPRANLEGTCRSRGDHVKLPYYSPLLGGHTFDRAEGSVNIEKLFALCTNLSNMVLALETVKDAQAKEILTLKARIKKLKKRCTLSISHHRAWLRSVAKLSKMKKLGQIESVSKQGRKSAKLRPKLEDSARLDVDGVEYIETEEAVDEGMTSNKTEELNLDADTEIIAEDKGSDEKGESTISTARPKRVSTAGVTISTTDPEVSAVEPKTPPTTTKVKESDRPARSVLTLKSLPTIDPKDKGKAMLKEPEPKKMTRCDFDTTQVARDEEIARQLEAELHEKVERERQRVEEASVDYIANQYNEVQAIIDADHELAVRLTHEEQKKYTALYIKEQEKVANFVPVGSDKDERLIQKMNEKAADVHKEKVLEDPDSTKILKMKARKKAGKQTHVDDESNDKGVDSSKKRKAGPRLKRMFKRQKTDADLKEEEHLKTFLKIASDEEEVVDYEIFRSDGSSRWIKTFTEMMTRTMFEANAEDELWQNQEEWSLKCWNFYENCKVHVLILEDGTEIHILAERRYPLTTKTLERMLSLRLIAESASDAAYDLLRFIQKQIDESGGIDRGDKDL